MKTFPKNITLITLLLLSGFSAAIGQSGFHVPSGGKIFFTGDSATIFSDVYNIGNLGVGKDAVVNFTGKVWENDSQSLITDESNGGEGADGSGGVVRFLSTDAVPQKLIGGYNAATLAGPAFSNLIIQSAGGVFLSGGNAKVRGELMLSDGLVYVKDNILIIGEGNPGIISGYDSSHYIVTDSRVNEGFLLRENITRQSGLVVFPVGSKAHAYTPAAIRSTTSLGDNFYVNVEDGVRGQIFRPTYSEEGVNTTWQIGKQLHPDTGDVNITLEHLNDNEGAVFAANRDKAYISQHMRYLWDDGFPQSMPAAGQLTTGDSIPSSGDNTRTFSGRISNSSYFTKFTGKSDSSKTELWFNGYRLDTSFVRVYWKTNPEINNKYFVVQRRLSTESDFTNVDTVMSKANGRSYANLDYEIRDFNKYHGVSYYRLLLVDKYNDTSYSQIIAVAGLAGKHRLIIWPNPTPDRFYVDLNGEVDVKTIIVWNVLGHKMHQEDVNGRQIMQMGGFIPGTYMIGFISTKGHIIETKKLIVIGR